MKVVLRSKPILAAFVVAAAVSVSAVAVPALAATKSVKVGDDYFVKPGGATVTVKHGTTVQWVWKGALAHNVTVRRGPVRFHSRTQTRGSYSVRLTKRGTYTIYCTIHGPVMSMKIRVT
jgi:plastocyanin